VASEMVLFVASLTRDRHCLNFMGLLQAAERSQVRGIYLQ